MNAQQTPILRTFELCTLQKASQPNRNIVIAMSSNHLTIGETRDDHLFSPKLVISLISQRHS